jgi:aspartyl-tRNA(Asn)/glutamyl-tRNA(Gln) amidotransferase subunit A
MHNEITRLDATRMAELIATRELSPVEVMQAHLDRIAQVDPQVNSIVTLAAGAKAAAQAAEAAIMSGAKVGPLHGVPFTVKDSIDTQGVLTQRGSPIFRGRVPDSDATAVARIKTAGGILIAKTNLPEFAYSVETDNLLSGRTNNPWNLDYTPGGSSGGEAAAIAAGMSPLGLGSDVAISTRGPAAHTGIVGVKATHGRVPATGHWPRVPRRFWHIGPMARSVRDVALAYSVLAGPDGADGFSAIPAAFDIRPAKNPPRVGWFTNFFGPLDPEVATTVQDAAKSLRDAGCQVEEVNLPLLRETDGVGIFWKLQQMETRPVFTKVAEGHEQDVFRHVEAIFTTPDTSVEDFIAAEHVQEQLRDVFADYFGRYDALLCPVTPFAATKHGLDDVMVDGKAYSPFQVMNATSIFSLTGLPAMTLRFGTSRSGLPIGVQIATSWYAESTMFDVASRLESQSPVLNRHPQL